MAWNMANPVPWRRLFKEWAVFCTICVVLMLAFSKNRHVETYIAIVVGGHCAERLSESRVAGVFNRIRLDSVDVGLLPLCLTRWVHPVELARVGFTEHIAPAHLV